jgi:hypothetical protein
MDAVRTWEQEKNDLTALPLPGGERIQVKGSKDRKLSFASSLRPAGMFTFRRGFDQLMWLPIVTSRATNSLSVPA